MTVYKAITPEATNAAELAVALLEGEEVPQDLVNRQKSTTAKRRAVGAAQPGRGDERQHQETRSSKTDSGPLDEICTGRLRGRLQRSGHLRLIEWHDGAPLARSCDGRQQALRRRSRRWTASTSTSTPARWSASSATTAPASRRWSRRSSGIHPPTRARSASTGEPVHDHAARRTRPRSASRPSTRTSRCATTSTSSPTCSSAARSSSGGPARRSRQLDEAAMEQQAGRAARRRSR